MKKFKYPDVEYTPVAYWQLPNSREEAKRLSGPVWFNGEMCKHGHVAPRYTGNGVCAVCQRAYTKKSLAKPHMQAVVEMGNWLTNQERRMMASAANEKRYTPLSACPTCGCTERYVSNNYCVRCSSTSARKRAS